MSELRESNFANISQKLHEIKNFRKLGYKLDFYHKVNIFQNHNYFGEYQLHFRCFFHQFLLSLM